MPTRLPLSTIEQSYAASHAALLPNNRLLAEKSFTLPMPPPNITGRLHLGHALDLSLQDILMRGFASRGANTSWIPGCDHAGQATHEKLLEKFLPGDDYLNNAKMWADEHREIIMGQFKKIHLCADWGKERYTLDDGYQKTCQEALLRLGSLGRLSLRDNSLYLDLKAEARLLSTAIESGEIKIYPASHANRLLAMLKEERGWDIGRKIPWGFKARLAGSPAQLSQLPEAEEFTMDTWFNSALWPTAIEHSFEKDKPPFLDGLIIGYDISFFWAARMLMMQRALWGTWCFHKIHLHGLIRDKQGRKFSKSLGNGIDPLEIIEKYGSDALRIWCIENAAWGRDFKYDEGGLRKCALLPTKILNACRFLQMNKPLDFTFDKNITALPIDDAFSALEEKISQHLQAFELNEAWTLMRKFAWDSWCEGYLKDNGPFFKEDSLRWHQAYAGTQKLLAMLHPFMPATSWWLSQQIKL